MKQHLANLITGCRMLCSILLLFFPVFSPGFFAVYLLCGFSDMADGAVARRWGSAGEWGARLDTAADVLFAAAALVKMLPTLPVPGWMWIWIAAIALTRICNLAAGFLRGVPFAALHTALNKATGFLLFLLPLTLPFLDWWYTSVALCAAATISALREGWQVFVTPVPSTAPRPSGTRRSREGFYRNRR